MNNYYWTKKKPTKEGWYWMKRPVSQKGIGTHIVQVREYAGVMCLDNWEIPSDAEWGGPIEEPTIPGCFDVEEYFKEYKNLITHNQNKGDKK